MTANIIILKIGVVKRRTKILVFLDDDFKTLYTVIILSVKEIFEKGGYLLMKKIVARVLIITLIIIILFEKVVY